MANKNDKKTFITEEGLKKLQDELNQLKVVKRKEIADRISEAKELGDLSENAEYIEAKEEQGFIETRILELEKKLKNYELIDHKKNTSTVQVGSTISVKDALNKEKTYTIVGTSEADPTSSKISNESPLGEAFLGHSVGDAISVQTPSGEMKFEILTVE